MNKDLSILDGEVLDLVVDYMTYVLIPALFLWKFELVWGPVSLMMTGLILFVGALYFSRKDMKTYDNWFNGFPASWNIIALIVWLLNTSIWFNSIIVFVSIILCATNVKFFHAVRSPQLRSLSMFLTISFIGTSFLMISINGQLHNSIGKIMISIWSMYYIAISIWRTWIFDTNTEISNK